MKLFKKFRFSSALDAGSTPEKLRSLAGADPELRHDAEEMVWVDATLRIRFEQEPPPGFLHGRIMHAVRDTAEHPTAAPRRRLSPAVGFAAAIALLLGFYFFAPRPAIRNPAASLQQQVATLPTKVLSPLNTEWESLQTDFARTTQFLLASVPQMDN